MPLNARDEYAARYIRRPTARERAASVWLLWLPLTTAGLALGRWLGLGVDEAAQAGGLLYLGVALLRGALAGAVGGAVQGLALLPFLKLRGWVMWIGATALGWAARSLALYLVGGGVVTLIFDAGGVALPIIGGITGLMAGAMLGLGQVLVVRRSDVPVPPITWVVACMGGAALGRIGAGFGMNFNWVNSLVLVSGAEALGVALVTGVALADGIHRRREVADNARAVIEEEAQIKATAEAAVVKEAGQWVETAPSPSLLLSSAGIGEGLAWRLVARNTGTSPMRLELDVLELKVRDSTGKLYPVLGIQPTSLMLGPGAGGDLEVQAQVLSYSPLPSTALYLDLVYTPASGKVYIFRHALPVPAAGV